MNVSCRATFEIQSLQCDLNKARVIVLFTYVMNTGRSYVFSYQNFKICLKYKQRQGLCSVYIT